MNEALPRRILFVQHSGSGGAIVSLSQIIAQLDPKQFTVTVLLLRNDSQAIDLLKKHGCEVIVNDRMSQFRHVFGGWSLLEPIGFYFSVRSLIFLQRSLAEFRELLHQIRPDLIYLNALPVFLYAYPSRQANIPVILHVREVALYGLTGIRRSLQRRVIERYVDHVIYIGEHEREQLGVSSLNSVISNYIDLGVWNRCHMTPVSEVKAKVTTTPTILFVGGLNKIKGVQILLPALYELKQHGVAFRCIFLGIQPTQTQRLSNLRRLIFADQGMEYEEVVQFIHTVGLDDNCELKPFITYPIEEYAQADILVFPSTVPHFPRPLIEAGALSIPVIASDLPGPRSVIKNGENGFLVEPNNSQLLADAIFKLLKDSELRKQMGKVNYETVKTRFNADINKRRILDLIESMSSVA